jgi:hypothetical protein
MVHSSRTPSDSKFDALAEAFLLGAFTLAIGVGAVALIITAVKWS